MISVEEALNLVEQNLPPATSKVLGLRDSCGCVLAQDVVSPMEMPPFRQSAMDGYALNTWDSLEYEIVGEVKAGDSFNPTLKSGEGVRIFTGAAVPDSANAVVMQERVEASDKQVKLESTPRLLENIRSKGEQIKKGELALKKGTVLNPAAIGFLAGLGIAEVSVYGKPSIAIVITGSELAKSDVALKRGQIYESNGVMLSAALVNSQFSNFELFQVDDDFKSTLSLLDKTLRKFDLIIVSGGISVGDYDFAGQALKELEVKEVFYKVNQKPGKPLFFGKKDQCSVFALPGNPASALICFYLYVLPALHQLSGQSFKSLSRRTLPSRSDFNWKAGRAQFLKAQIFNDEVEILEGQSSAMLNTFARANALVYISDNGSSIREGDMLEVICLPNN